MPAYFRSSLENFISLSATAVVGELAIANANAPNRFQLAPEAIDAWRLQLAPLQAGIAELLQKYARFGPSFILLEYPVPIVGKRIDAVVLVGPTVVVIETKTGMAPSSAVRQVEDYALNLACFHEACANRNIVPLVISNVALRGSNNGTMFDDLIQNTIVAFPTDFGSALIDLVESHEGAAAPSIDLRAFDSGRFKPIPRIVDAAVALYHDMNVFEIGHACAAEASLLSTTAALTRIVTDARTKGQKAICFVTGVPGAGKTLVGLNAVHEPAIRDVGSFLSGNGPLVRIIHEALVRDIVARSKNSGQLVTRADADLRVRTFIHNVHRFVDEHKTTAPTRRVVVFDEAQRAWDRIENEKAGREGSEPEMVLAIMNRHDDWAVIIALVGGGQEINRGEAGLAEWGRALKRFPNWGVFASPHVLSRSDAVAGFRLIEDDDATLARVKPEKDLHLDVAIRAIRAKQMSQWVNALLEGRETEARRAASQMQAKPLVCRELPKLRTWLKGVRRGTTRSGLVASSSASRLRADGIETSFDFHKGFEWEHWFLDSWECTNLDCEHRYCNDVRASSSLEVAGTQFEVQGLELDWVGLCWGEDLLWSGNQWEVRRFNNKTWKPQNDSKKAHYVRNGYRVLLTRARQQLAIYVPRANVSEVTRMGPSLDRTAEWLLHCGAVELRA